MLSLNIANMMSELIGENGIKEKEVEGLRGNILSAHKKIISRKIPELAFIDLYKQDTKELKGIAEWVKNNTENFLLLGIGGSALGPKCILESLSPMHNLRKTPKVFIYDNPDPITLKNILSIVDPKKTAINVITKSGTTVETMAGFMILYKKMKGYEKNIVATTDPQKGALKGIATRLGIKTLQIPQPLVGRYSVLSSVGLLLSEIIGVNADELLRGAEDMFQRCSEPEMWKNPAYVFGALLYLMDKKGRKINVLMPYSDRLKSMGEWFSQLWAESLGKKGVGLTPYPSLGTVDQHSQLQLWMDGPEDKVIIFIKVVEHGLDIKIPKVFKETDIGYLGGKSLSGLMNAEQDSTELCLKKAGRPSMRIELPRLNPYYLGQLFLFFELVTSFTGFLYGINPFDQPQVEEGKNFTYGMMGKKGFEAKKKEVEKEKEKKACWRI